MPDRPDRAFEIPPAPTHCFVCDQPLRPPERPLVLDGVAYHAACYERAVGRRASGQLPP